MGVTESVENESVDNLAKFVRDYFQVKGLCIAKETIVKMLAKGWKNYLWILNLIKG